MADLRVRFAQLETAYRTLSERNTQLAERNTLLTEEVRWLKAQLFGRSSEKRAEVSPEQKMLFNEAKVLAAIATAEAADHVVEIEAHERRKKRGRKAIPAEFPCEVVVHDLPEQEKICPHDGTRLQRIGQETAEQYAYTPPQLTVGVHERPKYACPCYHQGVKIAPPPAQLLPKSMADPTLLAHITTAKFVDGLPLTRQSKQFARLGLHIGAGTLGQWMNTIGGERVLPLISLMREALLEESFIHCDETPLQVLRSDKAPTSEHYMWAQAAGAAYRAVHLYTDAQ